MASKKANIIIDPLRLNDLSLLKPLFADGEIKKILHGADYDIRSLYRDFHITINNLFDTQIAASFLGLKATGLDALVQDKLNLKINKKYQKKDWSKRPLPEEMLEYAANDAICLIPLAKLLEKELMQKKRISWVYEESEILIKVRPPALNKDPLYLKFKGAGKLKSRTLAILEHLLKLRKKTAKNKDRPLFKIFSNKSMLQLAESRPENLQKLKKLKALSARQIDIYGRSLLEAINRGLNMPENKLPVYPRTRVPVKKPEVTKRAKAIKNWRDKKAAMLEIDPALLLNKAMINTIAVQNPLERKDLKKIKNMRNWQREEFGKDITEVLKKM
jgi:ribonuclease D